MSNLYNSVQLGCILFFDLGECDVCVKIFNLVAGAYVFRIVFAGKYDFSTIYALWYYRL